MTSLRQSASAFAKLSLDFARDPSRDPEPVEGLLRLASLAKGGAGFIPAYGGGKNFLAILESCGMLLAMQAQIIPRQVQKPILAPVMQQSIEVLLLSLTELHLAIDQELQNNPLLEINEEATGAQEPSAPEKASLADDLIRFSHESFGARYFTDDRIIEEKPIQAEFSLEDSLMQQLRVELSDPLEIKMGEYLIGNLDEDGYLKTTCAEAASLLGIQDVALIERVLTVIQGFEPLGIAARTLQECLLIQVKAGCHPQKEFLVQIIRDHLPDLGHKRFALIAKNTGLPPAEIKSLANDIARLDPKPARNFRPIHPSMYILPDAIIQKDRDNGYQVEITREGIPRLRVNSYYRNLLARKDLSEKDREFIQERLRGATNFIRSIEQRGQTLRHIAEYILNKQKAFFEGGEDLAPMILKDVAQAIGRNESTISRAIHSKFIDTPRGVFPIKFFFSQGIPATEQGFVASRSVKREIQAIITSEDKASPLSDQDIQHYFTRRKMQIARRTISKYRHSLRILPSNLRRI